jgi:hypothetical protein
MELAVSTWRSCFPYGITRFHVEFVVSIGRFGMTQDFSKREEVLKVLRDLGEQYGDKVIPLHHHYLRSLLQRFYDSSIEAMHFPEGSDFYRLPKHLSRHVRGHIHNGFKQDLETESGILTRDKHPFMFHSAPRRSGVAGDVPMSVDLYEFIYHPIFAYVHAGVNVFIVRKTYASLHNSIKLWKWESENEYKRVRIEKRAPDEPPITYQERFAKIGLRHLGFRWPSRSAERRRKWPELFEELGFSVTSVKGPLNFAPNAVLSILRGELSKKEAAFQYHVTEYEIKRWIKIYQDAGKAALKARLKL